MQPITDQRVGGHLSLHIPATVDAQCSCFCWNRQTPQAPVIVRGNSLVSVRRADIAETAAAVQAIYDEVIRRCHPDVEQANRIMQRAGLSLIEQPRALTVEQVQAISEQLD